MGIKTLPEVLSSTTAKSAEYGFSSIGRKIDHGIQSSSNKLKEGFSSLKEYLDYTLYHEGETPTLEDDGESERE